MWDNLIFIIKRLHERLWIKPLIVCALSIGAGFLAKLMDMTELGNYLPEVAKESTETMLMIMASSMLMMATFAVASMVAAYASASLTATPRSFPLIIGDDLSQNALSAFMGAFIFSVVALVAQMNGFYSGKASQFILFSLTIIVLVIIIIIFIRWVDKIARLGQVSHTIFQVEKAAEEAIRKRHSAPRLECVAAYAPPEGSLAVFGKAIGYVQHVDAKKLQARAEKSQLRIIVAALPGSFCTPQHPVAWVIHESSANMSDKDAEAIAEAFEIGRKRVFEQDPRFGLLVLSEIACHSLSPVVNDPGTAIAVMDSLIRLFIMLDECSKSGEVPKVRFDRVAVSELCVADMFDDAFTGIARDGAGTAEVVVRLLQALDMLAATGDPAMRENAQRHARLALLRAEIALKIPDDLTAVRNAAQFAG